MTNKPTPTDAELKAMWQIHAADIGGIFYYARAVLAKWGQPSVAGEEVENLRKALVYAAFALHDAPQYMLAQGIALIDGDTVRVSRDGWTVEASVNPHRQPAPAQHVAREPLTQAKVVEAFCALPHQVQFITAFDQGVRFAERHHGIKGGQHGTE